MSIARLEQLRQVVAEHDVGLAHWLDQGLDRWREGETLERALELTAADATLARDAALRRAARILDPEGQRRPWPLACELAELVRCHERDQGPRRRADPSPLQAALAEAFEAAGARGVPTSQRGLYRILADTERQLCQSVSEALRSWPANRNSVR